MVMPPLENKWAHELESELRAPYFAELMRFVDGEYTSKTCYPPYELIFEAFNLTPFDAVKAVIVGQDPYHEPGEAAGLAFYVPEGVKTPPSLVNIAKELASEKLKVAAQKLSASNVAIPDLRAWAKGGVLLLNSLLTVRGGSAGVLAHRARGWENFTSAVIKKLSSSREHLVFMLWGAHAQKLRALVDETRHLVIASAHPSPLSAHRGFFGSRPFARANEYWRAHNLTEVEW